jgi:hypothetical protein
MQVAELVKCHLVAEKGISTTQIDAVVDLICSEEIYGEAFLRLDKMNEYDVYALEKVKQIKGGTRAAIISFIEQLKQPLRQDDNYVKEG